VLNREDCLAEIEDVLPDILILGVNIYTDNELVLLDQIREKYPGVSVILFTDYGIDEYRKEAILRGANYTISKDLWTGSEILALINTILITRDNLNQMHVEYSSVEEDLLKQPLERRRKDPRGRAVEREFLAHHPDRRG
jgi:DNA-binding NarL/FixJ family response regulator